MASAPCQACEALRVPFEIATPDELTKAIRLVRESLEMGSLTDITQVAHSPSGKFANLPEVAPWPDYIEHYFRCGACGYRFRLAAETYHGAGGEWEPYTA